MCCLALYCRLAILLSSYCAYAQYYEDWPLEQKPSSEVFLYNPSNGEHMWLLEYLSNDERSRSIEGNVIELPTMGRICSCQDYACRCCLGMGIGDRKDGLCVQMKANRRDLSIRFDVDLNHRSVASFGISPRNIPDFCVPLTLPIPSAACLRLYNIHTDDLNLYLCNSLVFKMILLQVLEYKLNCLQLSLRGLTIIGDIDWDTTRIPQGTDQRQPHTTNDKLEMNIRS